MTCGFCHVSPNPVNPPPDPENPKWEHLSSIAGAQYMWVDRLFSWESSPDNFVSQLFGTWRPGTLDVSFVSQDNIDNPRSMNAVYNVGARMHLAQKSGKEVLAAENRENKQLNDFVPANSPLAGFFKPPDTVYTMHVLKDGSDSVGLIAALNRVYLNIGLFSEEWLLHFRPLIGGSRMTPIQVKVVRQNSVYWQATEAQSYNMAAFLLKAGKPHRLIDLPEPAASTRIFRQTRTRQKGVRGTMRALPLQQASHSTSGSESQQLLIGLPELLESLLELDQDRRLQDPSPRNRCETGFSGRQLSLY